MNIYDYKNFVFQKGLVLIEASEQLAVVLLKRRGKLMIGVTPTGYISRS